MTPPILLDVPESFESDRLLIRAPRPGDGEALQEAIEESLAELRPWMPWADEHQTVDVSEAYARRAYSEFLARTNLPLFLFRRDDGRFVGGSGLHRIDWSIPRFEIGYWVRTSLAEHGYATEAARRIADFAFGDLQAERVEIRAAGKRHIISSSEHQTADSAVRELPGRIPTAPRESGTFAGQSPGRVRSHTRHLHEPMGTTCGIRKNRCRILRKVDRSGTYA
jgi:RimJ/RimL family protein N-acetyltransferase